MECKAIVIQHLSLCNIKQATVANQSSQQRQRKLYMKAIALIFNYFVCGCLWNKP